MKLILKLVNGETFMIEDSKGVTGDEIARTLTSGSCFIGPDYAINGRHIIRVEIVK